MPSDPTSKELVVKYLRHNPGRHTNQHLADALNMPVGTVSSVTSVEYEKSRAHGGAGIYGFPHAHNNRLAEYAWCHSRPPAHELYIGPRKPNGNPRARTKAAPSREEELVLRRSNIAPDVWVCGDKTYKVKEVLVEVMVVEVDD